MADGDERAVSLEDLDAAPVNLAANRAAPPADYDELNKRFTQVSNDNFDLKQEIEALKTRVRTSEILDALIAPYASRAFVFMCAYCAFVGVLLLLSGWQVWGFKQPEAVLSLMVGSTAVTVIGLVGMVLTGIFVGARKSGS